MTTPQNLNEWKIIASYEEINVPTAMSNWPKFSIEKKSNYNQKFDLLRNGYPLDYLLNYTELNGYKFKLNEHVLIPRPETQQLVELIHQSKNKPKTIIDIGCGSGFIGIQLAQYFEQVIMTDVSQKAIDVAQQNLQFNNIQNIKILKSDLLNNIQTPNDTWWLVANLPYVPNQDKEIKKENNVVYEPELAIYSGVDGLDLWRELMEQLLKLSNRPEKMYFELDSRNIIEAQKYLTQNGIESTIIRDELNQERFLISI